MPARMNRRRAQADDPGEGDAGHEEGGAEGDGDQHGLADVGLQQEEYDGQSVHAEGDGDPGHALPLLRLGEHPRTNRCACGNCRHA